MISLYDNEGNVPLHSAVHGGDIRAVDLCLRSGAKISTQQHDLSTPVHLACAQVCVIFQKCGVMHVCELITNINTFSTGCTGHSKVNVPNATRGKTCLPHVLRRAEDDTDTLRGHVRPPGYCYVSDRAGFRYQPTG